MIAKNKIDDNKKIEIFYKIFILDSKKPPLLRANLLTLEGAVVINKYNIIFLFVN